MIHAYHSFSRPRPLPHRTHGFAAARAFVLLFTLAGLSHSAFAGVVPPDFYGSPSVTLNIDQADGTSWALDMSYMLSVDPSTGALDMLPTGSTLPTNWSWTTVSVFNRTTGQFGQKDGVMWHSDQKTGTAWDSTITFYGTGNVEPFLSYGFSARNATGSVQNYTFTYGESIVPPVGGSYSLYADIAGSVTNAVSGTPAQIAPVSPNTKIQILSLSTDSGTTLFDGGVDVGPAFATGPGAGTSIYGVYSDTLTGSVGTPIDYWQFQNKFSLTPGRDAAAFSGFADLEAIPEPSTCAALLGAMALGVAALQRRKVAGLLKF